MGRLWRDCSIYHRKRLFEALVQLFVGQTLYRRGKFAEEMCLSATTPAGESLCLVGQFNGKVKVWRMPWLYPHSEGRVLFPDTVYSYVGAFLQMDCLNSGS